MCGFSRLLASKATIDMKWKDIVDMIEDTVPIGATIAERIDTRSREPSWRPWSRFLYHFHLGAVEVNCDGRSVGNALEF